MNEILYKRLCEAVPADRVLINEPMKKHTRSFLAQKGVSTEQTLIVGDQLFTDIQLANALGIKSVLLEPLSNREWWCTKVFNRSRERLVWPFLFRK